MSLALSVQHATTGDELPADSTLRRWLSRALERDAAMTLRFVGNAEGRRLNREFRSHDYATNVLTFVYESGDAKTLSGDLVLCVPVLKHEAREQGKTFREHCAHLVIHGALHLLGYDHASGKDARVMEALETRLLGTLGYGDPYEDNR